MNRQHPAKSISLAIPLVKRKMGKVSWQFTAEELTAIVSIVEKQSDSAFVRKRRVHNAESSNTDVTETDFWQAHLASLLTSRQRSGPDSNVGRFLRKEIESLSLEQCRSADDLQAYVSTTLREYGGIQYYNNIAKYSEKNLQNLESDNGWATLLSELSPLCFAKQRKPRDDDYTKERQLSQYLHSDFAGEGFHGIGPKQSRNLLQILGLTRYETPLDSRITRWVNESMDLPYEISGGGLSHSEFYTFVMDIVQDACREADVLPCIFDAAVFSSYDSGWSEVESSSIF